MNILVLFNITDFYFKDALSAVCAQHTLEKILLSVTNKQGRYFKALAYFYKGRLLWVLV